jgi:hypothetical protein
MTVAIDDLPPLMWHAELGRSLPDLWSGDWHRGAQLHDLRSAVLVWAHRYGQRAWLRQLDAPVGRPAEDALLRTVAVLDGTPFPSMSRLAGRWVRHRAPDLRPRRLAGAIRRRTGRAPAEPPTDPAAAASLETAYCAEVLAVSYRAMGLLPGDRLPSWYDPGRFWSGDELELTPGWRLGGEIAVDIPPGTTPPTG